MIVKMAKGMRTRMRLSWAFVRGCEGNGKGETNKACLQADYSTRYTFIISKTLARGRHKVTASDFVTSSAGWGMRLSWGSVGV